MPRRKTTPTIALNLLGDPHIRHGLADGKTVYAIEDVLTVLLETAHPAEAWADLKRREPALALLEEWADFETDAGDAESLRAVDAAGLFRVAQSLPSPRAERLKKWLAESGVQRLEDLENPEAVLARVRQAYEQRGYSARWVDKRLRGVSTRHEVTSEWARRGATASDDYRALTNVLIEGAFGMDVESMRASKGLTGTPTTLRDAMTDFELVLTTLAETAAVELHRARDSRGLPELLEDARDAGRSAGLARNALAGLSTTPRHNASAA
ncbi:MAG TPA: hypothetical protein VEA69_10265 [Tepidisphaeraceae bacterium]|nr:hypothetical protein [Tepidisphaeraceae bacterium]